MHSLVTIILALGCDGSEAVQKLFSQQLWCCAVLRWPHSMTVPAYLQEHSSMAWGDGVV